MRKDLAMSEYFFSEDLETQTIFWGDPKDMVNAIPVVIFPAPPPPDIVEGIVTVLNEQDEKGTYPVKISEEMRTFGDKEINSTFSNEGLQEGVESI